MSDEKKIGDINVEMGDGNRIDHIGHKFVFHKPPPSPNAIFQNGAVAGEIGSAPIDCRNGVYRFEKIFTENVFQETLPFELQGGVFQIVSCGARTSASFGGRPPQCTLWHVICQLVR